MTDDGFCDHGIDPSGCVKCLNDRIRKLEPERLGDFGEVEHHPLDHPRAWRDSEGGIWYTANCSYCGCGTKYAEKPDNYVCGGCETNPMRPMVDKLRTEIKLLRGELVFPVFVSPLTETPTPVKE